MLPILRLSLCCAVHPLQYKGTIDFDAHGAQMDTPIVYFGKNKAEILTVLLPAERDKSFQNRGEKALTTAFEVQKHSTEK